MQCEPAEYYPQDMLEFCGNPLIECLPILRDTELYQSLLLVTPPYSDEERKEQMSDRLFLLQRLAQLHIPTVNDRMILLSLARCMTWGYVSRNPIPFEDRKRILVERGITISDDEERYLKTTTAPIYGFPIIGLSGTGKTTSTTNVLSLFPQVIEHTEYCGIPFRSLQLVWLKVDCPGDATPKGLCSAILRGIDEVLNTDYCQTIMKNRMSKDVLVVRVSQLVQKLHLGILIIDDIQNICGKKNAISDELLSFMVSMANNLKIPVIMVGTPKVLTLLQREFQQAKRASGEGEIRMDLMPYESSEWKRFIGVLWRYQYTREKVPLTEEMNRTIYEESVGNPFVAATLYKVTQDEAITSKNETFTAADIRRVAKTKMGMTAKMRKDMLNGVDPEMNQFRNLWFTAGKQSAEPVKSETRTKESDRIMNDLIIRLTQDTGIAPDKARRYAIRAMAALPGGNLDEMLGYVNRLREKESALKDTKDC